MIVPRLLLLALVVGNAVAGSVAIGTNNTVESSTLLRRRAQQESDELSAQHDDHRALKGVDSKTVDRYKAVPKGYRKNPSYYSETYLRRAGEYHDFKALAKEWGSWTLPALSSNQKVDESFYQGFPNRDVPRHDFPSSAWQVDKNYLSKFLPEAMALTERAMEAILSEYGFGKNENKDQTFDERSVNFRLYSDKSNPTGGGWMPPSSYQGLQRRLLHAVMTQVRLQANQIPKNMPFSPMYFMTCTLSFSTQQQQRTGFPSPCRDIQLRQHTAITFNNRTLCKFKRLWNPSWRVWESKCGPAILVRGDWALYKPDWPRRPSWAQTRTLSCGIVA